MDEQLYVIVPLFNPLSYDTRNRLFERVLRYVVASGGVLVPVECAYEPSPFMATTPATPYHRQFRTSELLWFKENLINLGLASLPDTAHYVCWIDGDIRFVRPDWVQETITALKSFTIVQMFSQALFLSPRYEPHQRYRSFAWCYTNNMPHGRGRPFWHPGLAWASTRNRLSSIGGLLDRTLGSADHHMAYGLIGRIGDTIQCSVTPAYERLLDEWQARATEVFGRKIGYLDGTVLHYWHGKMGNRQYLSRWEIVRRHAFDPACDFAYRPDGLLSLTAAGARMVADLRTYFKAREEDSVEYPEDDLGGFVCQQPPETN